MMNENQFVHFFTSEYYKQHFKDVWFKQTRVMDQVFQTNFLPLDKSGLFGVWGEGVVLTRQSV